MFKHACSGLEGVVSKVRDSRYVSGRSNDWVKETCAQRETLQNAGFAMKENKFDGLYVGRQKGRDLIYAGKVDLGFDSASAKELQARLLALRGEIVESLRQILEIFRFRETAIGDWVRSTT
jgi:bifunctional non-homologous end joining protein LigD